MRIVILGVLCIAAAGCAPEPIGPSASSSGEYENSGPVHPNPPITARQLENGEPSHITVQHILIAYSGSVEGKSISRSIVEAKQLANQVFEKAKTSDDFDGMVKEYTDDSHPGIYRMANFTIAGDMSSPNKANWIYERGGMVPAFGNIGFQLQVGEVGMSTQDRKESPYGWHIIKRVE